MDGMVGSPGIWQLSFKLRRTSFAQAFAPEATPRRLSRWAGTDMELKSKSDNGQEPRVTTWHAGVGRRPGTACACARVRCLLESTAGPRMCQSTDAKAGLRWRIGGPSDVTSRAFAPRPMPARHSHMNSLTPTPCICARSLRWARERNPKRTCRPSRQPTNTQPHHGIPALGLFPTFWDPGRRGSNGDILFTDIGSPPGVVELFRPLVGLCSWT